MEKEILDYRGKPRVQTDFGDEESLTVQSEAHLADIGKILKKYDEVGIIDHLAQTEAVFADVTEYTDYADAMRNLKVAEATFMKLPSKIREIFNHDVADWLDAAHDPKKREKLVEAGFVPAEVVEEVIKAAPVEPMAPKEASGEKVSAD